MAANSRPCASQNHCQIGIIERDNGTTSTFHRCRQCRELLCSILCSALQEEEEFLCFPCHNNSQHQQQQASSDDDKENEHPQQQQQQKLSKRSSTSSTTTTPAPFRRRQALETPTFRPGDLVDVAPNGKSFGGKAWVTEVSHTPGGHATYDAKYILPTSKKFTPNVPLGRLDAASLEPSARIRQQGVSSTAAAIQPSLLSRNYMPTTTTENVDQQKSKSTNQKLTTVQQLLKDAHEWNNKKEGDHPIVRFIKRNAASKNFERGYLRHRQAKDEKRTVKGKHLTEHEWTLIIKMRDALEGRTIVNPKNNSIYSPMDDFAAAWGTSRQVINRKRKRVLLDDPSLSLARKKRCDAGTNIFDSQKKREEVFTPYQVYKKERMKQSTVQDPLEAPEIRADWERLIRDNNFLRRYEIKATLELKQAVHLKSEIVSLLQKTNGSITWSCLESKLAGGRGKTKPVTGETIRKYVMGLPDSCYKSTRIHPKLDDQHRARRFNWTKGFWIFWQTAKLLAEEVQIIKLHSDEKWFFTLVIRRLNKCIPFFGILPVNHAVHHKSHIYKTMYIATEAFEPHNNDIEKGGLAHKLSFTRVGKMGTAQKNTYKRVYKDDGSYHYPKLPENILQKKGDPKWVNLEVNGSKEGTAKAPKFSLKKWFLEVKLPRLDELAAWRQFVLKKRIIIRYQWDGAGPHQDGDLLETIYFEFAKRGWLFVFQPSQSPLTNINDACIFPALSKKVSEEQGLTNGSLGLSPDRLAEVAEDVFWKFPEDTIARAFAGHHQIVNAIYAEEGGDEFAKAKGGLHCGIRKAFVPTYAKDEPGEHDRPIGVELFESPDEVDASSLKYKTPDVLQDKTIMAECGKYLTGPELDFLIQETEQMIEKGDAEDEKTRLLQKLWFAFGEASVVVDPPSEV